MKVPVSWLKEYIQAPFEVEDLAHRLTMAGTEVASISETGSDWDGVCVGLVLAVNSHPNADRLRLVTVDSGSGTVEVVCGAPNVAPGQKICYARIGACLVDGHTGEPAVLKPAKIRGVVSSGMVCSEKELGLSDEHEGILVLPESAPVGTSLRDYLGETVLDLEVTPNRPDMLSVIGIAREVGALMGKPARVVDPEFTGTGKKISSELTIDIEAPDLCPRYTASLIKGITIGESPDWLKRRLVNAGMRPINNVVDVTNYVMLEYGQPLHAFDFDKLSGARITVRRAREGQVFVTLDGAERKLTGEMLMICDGRGEVAIAGVMGGANSEVVPGTTSVLLESASFNPASIHYTSSKLGLSSAASQRFERGQSPFLTLPALNRATRLIIEVAGGEAAQGVIDAAPGLKPHQQVTVGTGRINSLLGTNYPETEIIDALVSLGCTVKSCQAGSELAVTAPEWRSDINLEADVVEEVARFKGYDNIPMTMLAKSIPHQSPSPMLSFKHRLREAMVGLGFQEILNWSMTNTVALSKALNQAELSVRPLYLKKPMTLEQECLRTSLRPGLLSALASNRRFEDSEIQLFELGTVYLPAGTGLPEEPQVAGGIMGSSQVKRHWSEETRPFDFYDLKGKVEALLGYLGASPSFEPCQDSGLKPGRQAAVLVKDVAVGVIGEVNPQAGRAFEIDEPVYYFEIDITRLLPLTVEDRQYQPIPRYPAVVRDIALVMDTAVKHRQVEEIIAGFPLVAEVRLFDIYAGKPVPAGNKSMAYRLTFQSQKKTLTDDAVDRVLEQILARLSSGLGAVLRR